ncbi:fumarylacetoacetate hydrolase [Sphingopyxis bauzanensis]|uniref:Fumarylacetoacetate hydrolase n=1 Tax=Sphingopyxis bauzanensis TaxID=651663 RepID=A0A246JR04_9SPHN|nr:fumarylacetoacetate hydrolase family protein [Sphingopyxis bauzanensis]OWQ95461.1 fumarylacetoacetate hydrolase [Sphingopyxis bauzanensis]GGJ53174.1 5-oxopent-3-ene-1,2,5-tricarboxylate decarboxylase [Sphingopyxis bauzanensis]
MKFISYRIDAGVGIALETAGEYRGLTAGGAHFPGTLGDLLRAGEAELRTAAAILGRYGARVDPWEVELLPPVDPGKIICIGLNYADHAAEAGLQVPDTPTVFSRFASSIVGAEAPIVLPKVSSDLDFEGELAVVIGKRGRHIDVGSALDHVAGYSCFNDGSIRDYQLRTPQWMIGKNFDRSGSLGPALVTADALPMGASGLAIRTRLNGDLVQSSSTRELIFDVATLVSLLSEAFELSPGDVIATGTPAGVGLARTPPLWMKAGDVCEVEIEGIGTLRNVVQPEPQ